MCARVVSPTGVVSAKDISAFAARPLENVIDGGLSAVVSKQEVVSDGSCKDGLPFDISQHPAAKSAISRDILSRLAADVDHYIAMKTTPASLTCIESASPYENLKIIRSALTSMKSRDQSAAEDIVESIVKAANEIPDERESEETLYYALYKRGGQRNCIDFNIIVRALMSNVGVEDLLSLNPFLQRDLAESICNRAACVLFSSTAFLSPTMRCC